MSLIKKQLFNELYTRFLLKYEDVDALIASDHEGFIIAGQKKEGVDMELVSVLTALINPVLERIQNEFAFKKFGSASFDTEENRLLFISIDENTTLSVVLDTLASVDKISPYAYFLAEKTAQIINANEALKIGLVNKVVPQEKLLDEAKNIARKIANKGKVALSLAKEAINRGFEIDIHSGLAFEIECFSLCFSTQDQKEGFLAFFEKRKPQFKDK